MTMPEPAKPSTSSASLTCLECGRPWLEGAERWRLYLTRDDPPDALPYCPECAEREFD
jgi:hypothetical protein